MADVLWHVADQAYPTDPALMPADVKVVLGYVGALHATPHIWTMREVANVQAHGKLWAPIHTVPPHWVGAGLGKQAAQLMLDELKLYVYPKTGPVFLDVEHSTYAENPHAVLTQVADWQATMQRAGHFPALAYLPWSANRQWVANWTGERPTTLPASLAGWQYEQAVHGRGYDLSMFRASVFDNLRKDPPVPTNGLTKADQEWIVAQLVKLQDQLHQIAWSYYADNNPEHPHPAANVHLHQQLVQLQTDVTALKSGPVDVNDLAVQLAARLGPDLGSQLVHALAAKLGP